MIRVVRNSKAAARDIEELDADLTEREGAARAGAVVGGVSAIILNLAQTGERGHAPHELSGLGRNDLLEVHFKPYRIVYRLEAKTVTVLIVADGRRDFASLLTRRLLR